MSEKTADCIEKEITSHRVTKIANLSFVCACLVVMIHTPWSTTRNWMIEHFIAGYLPIIAVPVFFIISGYMLARHCGDPGWWKAALKKRMRSLVIPFFALNILWFPVKFGVHWIGVNRFGADGSVESMQLTVKNFLLATGIFPWGTDAMLGFWYIRALVLLVVISPLLHLLVKTRWRAILSIAALSLVWAWQTTIVGGGGTRFVGESHWLYELNLRCPLFFMIGMCVCLHAKDVVVGWKIKALGVVLALLLYNGHSIVQNPFVVPLVSLVTILLTAFAIWSVVPEKKFPKQMTSNSFALFVIHSMVLYLMQAALKGLHCWREVIDVLGVLPMSAIVIGVSLIVATLAKNLVPRFTAVVLGGR